MPTLIIPKRITFFVAQALELPRTKGDEIELLRARAAFPSYCDPFFQCGGPDVPTPPCFVDIEELESGGSHLDAIDGLGRERSSLVLTRCQQIVFAEEYASLLLQEVATFVLCATAPGVKGDLKGVSDFFLSRLNSDAKGPRVGMVCDSKSYTDQWSSSMAFRYLVKSKV